MPDIKHTTFGPGIDGPEWEEAHTIEDASIGFAKLVGAAASTHSHAGEDITSGTVADARVASTITRDSEAAAAYSAIGHDHDGTPEAKLAQANTHESPDTDTATTALHHTLGTGANQAAAGDHNHTSLSAQAAALDMNSHKITNVTDPTSNQDAATKKYVDDTVSAGGAITITEVDTSPSVVATKLILPNGTLSVSGTEATYTPATATPVGATLQRLSRTAGSLTLTANVSTMTEVSSLLRLTIAAAVGDVLQIGLSAMCTGTTTQDTAIDSATIVSGSIVNQVSAGTRGVGHGYVAQTVPTLVGSTLTYVVQSGDISGGNVTLSLTFINTHATTAGTLYATTVYALTYWVLNLKH